MVRLIVTWLSLLTQRVVGQSNEPRTEVRVFNYFLYEMTCLRSHALKQPTKSPRP